MDKHRKKIVEVLISLGMGLKYFTQYAALVKGAQTLPVYFYIFSLHFVHFCLLEAGGGAVARSVTVKPTGCGFDPQSRR